LGVAIFQGEVEMAGFGSAKVGDFAFDPSIGVFAFDVGADCGDQVADFPDSTVRGSEVEA